jgi:hypothetical protein
MGGRLKTGLIPRGIPMIWPSHCAKSSLRPNFVGPDLEREKRSQKSPPPSPADLGMNLEDPRVDSEAVVLNDLDVFMAANDS